MKRVYSILGNLSSTHYAPHKPKSCATLPVRLKIEEPLQNRTRHVGEALSLPPAAQPPWLPCWGVAERSESFKIMISGGNHSTVKSWQPAGAMQASNRRRRLLASRRGGVVRISSCKKLVHTKKTSWKIPGGHVCIIDILPCISGLTVPFF